MLQQTKNLVNSIFISKSLHEVPELAEFCRQHSISLIARSMIRFEAVPFHVKQPYQVIFFSSIRAAEFFLKTDSIDENTQVACIGRKTAEKLQKLGITAHFIGEKAGKPEEVARDFAKWLGDRSVLIPQSDISKRSMIKELDPKQVQEVVVYRTLSDCHPIESSDVYVFTSPSNFDGFIACNPLPDGKLIAWGTTTHSAMEQAHCIPTITLERSELSELIRLLHNELER